MVADDEVEEIMNGESRLIVNWSFSSGCVVRGKGSSYRFYTKTVPLVRIVHQVTEGRIQLTGRICVTVVNHYCV